MKKILLSLIIVLSFVVPSFAATLFCGASSSETGDGSDWSNKCDFNTQTLVRGNTYYLADGSYSKTTFNTAASGSTYIYVKKCHAGDTTCTAASGYSAADHDGQAVFSQMTFTTNYWDIDGQVGGGPGSWKSGHGIKVDYTGTMYAITVSGASYLVFRHMEVEGSGHTYDAVNKYCDRGIYGNGSDNVTISYCWFYNNYKGPIDLVNSDNLLIEYSSIGPNGTAATEGTVCHSMGISLRNNNTVTLRYNIIEDISETGYITQVNDAAGENLSNVSIYGNVFWVSGTASNVYSNYIFHLGRSNTTYSNWKVYNNDFVNFTGSAAWYYIGISGSGNEIKNNIYYNNVVSAINPPFSSTYNYYQYNRSSTGANVYHSEMGGQVSTSATTPFINSAAYNFGLVAPTNTGTTLSSPYNTDMLGNTRGADGNWDRGALEGGGTVEDNVAPTFPGPNTPNGTIACDASSPVDVTFTIGTNENATCTYSATDVAYASATVMSSTGGTTHTQTVALACDASYTYYFKCRDTSPAQNTNTSSNDLALSFTVQAGATEAEVPVMSNPLPVTGSRFACTANPLAVTLGITATDESGVTGCQYALTDVAYGAEGGVALDTTGGTPIEDIDASYATTNYSNAGLFIGYGAATTLSQSFESNGGTLNTAQFYLRKYAGATGNIVATLYAGSGTIGGGDDVGTGEILATSDAVDISTLSSSAMQLTTFTFSGANRVTLTDGNHYVIGVYYTGVASTQVLYAGSDNTSPSHTGNTCYEDGGWTALSGYDLVFYVNVMRGGSGDYSKSVNFACGASYNVYYRCTDGTHPNTTPSSTTFTVYSATPANATEAESDTETTPMMAVEDIQASGGYYVASTTANSGSTTLTINVATAGTYRIGARVFASGSGTDSMFVKVNEEDECVWHFNPTESSQYYNAWYNDYVNCQGTGTFTAPQYDPYVVTLTSGDNTFTFRGREAGSRLDYVWLEPYDMPVNPVVPSAGTTRFMVGVGQTMTISPTTGGCTVVIE